VTALSGKYLKEGSDFLNTTIKPTSSWMWKGLLKARVVDEKGACLAISNGQHVNVWTSPWVPTCSSFRPTPNPNLVGFPEYHVDELIDPNNRSRNVLIWILLLKFKKSMFHSWWMLIDGFGLLLSLGNFF